MKGFLEYIPGDSFLHHMNPIAKLFCALCISLACFCTGNPLFLLIVLGFDLLVAHHCRMIPQTLSLMKAVFFFSLILAIIQILTTPTGIGIVDLPWGYIGTGGLVAALTTILRLIAAAIPLFLVLYVTKLSSITNALCKVVHIPYKYAFTFASTVRFIPVFMNDMSAIMEAQTARGVEFDQGGFVKKAKLMIPLCVPLLVSSVRKTGSAAIAAEVRGFNLRTSASGYKEYPFATTDIAAMVAGVALIAVAVSLQILPPLF